MLVDFLTKPLQGSAFMRMRDIIILTGPLPVEERVREFKFVKQKPTKKEANGNNGNNSNIFANRNNSITYAEILKGVKVRYKKGITKQLIELIILVLSKLNNTQ